MNYYFIALLILLAMSLGINLTRHGQQRTDNYIFFTSLIAVIIETVLVYFAIKTGFFAGLGMLETALLFIGGIIIYADIKRADQEED